MLHVEFDLVDSGRCTLTGPLVLLARAADVLAQEIAQPGDVLCTWSLHQGEQDEARMSAYANERAITGAAQAHVIELARPRQRNVVWLDRLHLITWGLTPMHAGQLFGLYVGSPGKIAAYVGMPQVAQTLNQHVASLPNMPSPSAWLDGPAPRLARYALHYDSRSPNVVDVWVAPALAQAAAQALNRIA